MEHRGDFGFVRYGEDESYAVCEKLNSAPIEQSDICPAQLGQPDQEDCSNGVIPYKAEPMGGKRKILVPVLTTMNKFLFDNYRLSMYTYVNRQLRNGTLSKLVGARVLNKVMNRESLSFPHVTFWRIDRTSFYADVKVELKLETQNGALVWNGYLILWCAFLDKFECSCEELTDKVDRKDDGYDQLDPYLIPYHTNKRVDEIAEGIWNEYLPEALTDPLKRDATKLAAKMGLAIKPCRIYEHDGVTTILFFEEDDLAVGDDRIEQDENGKKEHVKARNSDPERIMENTIVVNKNLPRWKCMQYGIFHECYHYEEHYMFYRLQKMGSNDPRKVVMREIVVDDDYKPDDPIYFMEKQANRGAYGLMFPVTSTREHIERLYQDVGQCRHAGERYEAVGKKMGIELLRPHFRIRARMIQLGYIQAKGSLNYVERKLIEPFAFDTEAWREEQHTFVIDPGTVEDLCKENDDFRGVMDSKKYIYADGHIVRNDERFVRQEQDQLKLTDWANAHVDACCIRFVRVYDADYVKQTKFYLSDLINSRHMDELDAQMRYTEDFPRTFKNAFELIMHKNGETQITIAQKLGTNDRTLREWLNEPERKISYDFVVVISLIWKLPDWISKMLLARAFIQTSLYDRRHQALEHIRVVMWDQGVDEANKYLADRQLNTLSI